MAEIRQDAEREETDLTTADLANLNEPASKVPERGRETEADRAASNRDVPAVERRAAGSPAATGASQSETEPLFPPEELNSFHSRWDAIQVSFVDEPRQAVQQADGLVANAMKRLAEVFAEERGHLDQQWDRGGDVSTEDLRIALRRYRSFFGRLLSV